MVRLMISYRYLRTLLSNLSSYCEHIQPVVELLTLRNAANDLISKIDAFAKQIQQNNRLPAVHVGYVAVHVVLSIFLRMVLGAGGCDADLQKASVHVNGLDCTFGQSSHFNNGHIGRMCERTRSACKWFTR